MSAGAGSVRPALREADRGTVSHCKDLFNAPPLTSEDLTIVESRGARVEPGKGFETLDLCITSRASRIHMVTANPFVLLSGLDESGEYRSVTCDPYG